MTILRNMRMDGTVDTNNSTTVALGIDGIFTGIATDVSNLKQNEDYCLRFIGNAAGYVSYRLSWYEHVAKN